MSDATWTAEEVEALSVEAIVRHLTRRDAEIARLRMLDAEGWKERSFAIERETAAEIARLTTERDKAGALLNRWVVWCEDPMMRAVLRADSNALIVRHSMDPKP